MVGIRITKRSLLFTRNGKKWPVLGYLPAGCYEVRTYKARFSRALCARQIMGRSTQTLKTDLRDPVLRSRSTLFDTARSQQLCQIRIKTPAYRADKVVY